MAPDHQTIELNAEFKKALDLLEYTGKNIFITGAAGTGKSTFLEYFRAVTSKRVVVLAPTGVAAVNVKGQTIHSFFRFKPDITPDKVKRSRSKRLLSLYSSVDMVIVDEVSMVRADILDCMDKSLRLNREKPYVPFGGVQMIFIGDLSQLPPVVAGAERELFRSRYESPYFFSAKAFQGFDVDMLELKKIYRQKDAKFIELLKKIRDNSIDHEGLREINLRVGPYFDAEGLDKRVYITPTNAAAARINEHELLKLDAELRNYTAEVGGEFDRRSMPVDEDLRIGPGAQVMFLNNDEDARWVNGTVGKVIDIREEKPHDIIVVELDGGRVEEATPHKWELFRFKLDPVTGDLISEVAGTVIQYPLKLSWAITIHKSQGKTFDSVVIDIGGGIFDYGQVYVALSRCRSLENITLTRPIEKRHIFTDKRVSAFVSKFDL